MNMNAKTSGLGLLLPAVLNPTVAAAIGIGLVGLGIYRLFGDDDENGKSEFLELSLIAEPMDGHTTFDSSGAAHAARSEQEPLDAAPNTNLK